MDEELRTGPVASGQGCRAWTMLLRPVPGRFLPLPARPGLFCQPKCQHGRLLSDVPADKGHFASGGPEQCPFLFPSQGPCFSGWRGGQLRAAGWLLLSHPAQPSWLGSVPRLQKEESAPELFLLKGEEWHFIWGDQKASVETIEVFLWAPGLFARAWPAKSCPWRRDCCHWALCHEIASVGQSRKQQPRRARV